MQRSGAQSDDSCIKFSASPSSSEYNAPIQERQPLNICDVLPPPPDHPYGAYKPPNNMTIRTNPVAMSPQICRRTAQQSRWPTLPVQNYTQNWQQNEQQNYHNQSNRNISDMVEEENDYESGSVLYEQCCRPEDNLKSNRNFFNYGEPTEEYYRNINMEFLDENEFDGHLSPPPEPCPDTLPKNRLKHNNANSFANQSSSWQQNQSHPNETNHTYDDDRTKSLNDQSPVNSRRSTRNQGNGSSSRSAQSSEESESDNNRWPRQEQITSRTRRTRSKSGDRKFRNGFAR